VAIQIREPFFGITCLARSTESAAATETISREAGGRATSVRLSGTVPTSCGLSGTLSGTSSSVSSVTITLI